MNNYRRVRGFEVVQEAHRKYEGDVILPTRSDERSAGYDFYTPVDTLIPAYDECIVFTDIKSYMLADEYLALHMRSSHGKLGIRFANTVGIIDSSYYNNPSNDGNIGIHFVNHSDKDILFKKGERIAQGIFQKYLLADNDEPVNQHRSGGFGSSGK